MLVSAIRRAAMLAGVVGLVGGCGDAPSRVILYVYGELEIPTELNELELRILDADFRDELTAVSLELADDDTYPIKILVEPASGNPKKLRASITGLLDGTPVAAMVFDFTWAEGEELRANEVEKLSLQPL